VPEHVAALHGGHVAVIRCRSEPQMARAVILMMASRGCSILG
jgi:hypothetical protein